MSGLNWLVIGAAVLLVLLVLSVSAVVYGSLRWERGSQAILARLEAARMPPSPARYNARELDGLPAPVQRFFRAALQDGQAMVTAASVTHVGTFNMSATAE